MNRRQKIIVSVTGIFLVLLILVGLTYAFFVTRIRGNNNPTSISVETANLELVYQDNDSSIIGQGMVIEPDTVIGEKTFTVTNNGNATIDDYAVIIENLAVKYVETQTVDGNLQTEGEVTSLVNGEDGNPDMKLVIECTSSVEGKTCNGMNGFLPEKSGILLTNSIEEDEVQTYTATLTYLEDGTNQSDDMNKTIEGKFNIIDTNNTVDIEGIVTGYTKGDFVQINSEEKESVIYSDGTYKFVGVKPNNHKITVRYRENGEEKLRGSEPTTNISIVKGESAGVEGNVITITDLSRTVKIDVAATTNAPTVSDTIKDYNPYKEGTLAYEILNNSFIGANETKFVKDLGYNVATKASTYAILEEPITRTLSYSETSLVDYFGFYGYWGHGDTEEEARNNYGSGYNSNYTSYSDYVGKYVFDCCSMYESVFYVESIDKNTGKPIVRIGYDIERLLTTTQDDDGTSYYFRGAVGDNYVDFAGMCWKIVRINGDDSIKLILEDKDNSCKDSNGNYGYNASYGLEEGTFNEWGGVEKGILNYLTPKANSETAMVTVFKNFQETKLNNYTDYLKAGDWCINENAYGSQLANLETATPLTKEEMRTYNENGTKYYYEPYIRLANNKESTLKCTGTTLTKFDDDLDGVVEENETDMYVATLTADEAIHSGMGFNDGESYMFSPYYEFIEFNSHYNSLTLSSNYYIIGLWKTKSVLLDIPADPSSVARPTINLKAGTPIISGDGTKNNAYKIQTNTN